MLSLTLALRTLERPTKCVPTLERGNEDFAFFLERTPETAKLHDCYIDVSPFLATTVSPFLATTYEKSFLLDCFPCKMLAAYGNNFLDVCLWSHFAA